MPKSRTFSLYLAKENVTNFEDVLSESARDRVKTIGAIQLDSDALGDGARLYIFQNLPIPPTWLSDISSVFGGLPEIKNRSSCAIVVFRHAERLFITAFAHGWQYIDDTTIESDFGLRVAINTLDDRKVRRIDRSHLGEAMKGVSQSAFQRDLQAFGIDEALDLVRRISGRVEDDDFANSVSGATALKITRAMNLSDLAEAAEEALSRSQSNDYQSTGFHIIDKVRPILDRLILAELDDQAVRIIRDGGDNFELSMPGWSEEDVVYFGLKGPGISRRFPDLLMENYRAALGDKLDLIDAHTITSKHGVFAEFNNDVTPRKQWSIKKALIGSITLNGGLYAISEGDWYRLDQQFKQDVDAGFEALKEDWPTPPVTMIKKVSDNGNRAGFESELSYNRRCAIEYDLICLDQEILTVPAVPYGKFEACDLLDIKNKRLIHVKKSSRQSSVLSHFFKQGSNSARILKTFPEAREILIEKVKAISDDENAESLQEALGEAMSGWRVEFHIADAPRKNGSFTIPFFSRITLREEARVLKGMDLSVALRFIPTIV